MRLFGLIGKPLGHSFSARYFNEKFEREGVEAQYQLEEIDLTAGIHQHLIDMGYEGVNVTYPYKNAIIPYLDEIDEVAQTIGAVNTIAISLNTGCIKGFNTDWIGFKNAILPYLSGKEKALVLGTGGASKAIQYALNDMGIDYTLVSRDLTKGIGYDMLTREIMQEHKLLIQCTPLGMAPLEEQYPNIPYQWIGSQHIAFDCIYDPQVTVFLNKSKRYGAKIINGLEMLKQQADAAWKIWNRF